jgi:CRISPR-associated exonuclease Cas4
MRDSISGGKLIITAWDISQYHYCKRKIYFLKILGVPAPLRRKMEHGAKIDKTERKKMLERKTIYGFEREAVEKIVEKLHLYDETLGLEGVIDQTILLKTEEVVPVDVKYTDLPLVQRQHKKQLVAYALLLDKYFETDVRRGVIYLAKQRKSLEVSITWRDKEGLMRDLEAIRGILSSERIPRKASSSKCGYCEVRRFCEAY